ncbi:hypothetical protein F5Y15DRAFT_274938 [Xylariaceae sp. FL0016]|nr:hypothetical protein F5Y15DRAFT_274938 [Xylariaceae sp. FL0016]
MQPRLYSAATSLDFSLQLLFTLTFFPFFAFALSSRSARSVAEDLRSNYFDPSPSPEDGPQAAFGALRDNAYLPAQIGGIVGAYALSLVIVAAVLLLLAKKRREALQAADAEFDPYDEFAYEFAFGGLQTEESGEQYPQYPYPPQTPKSPVKNYSYPSPPTPSAQSAPGPYVFPTFHSSSTLPSTLGHNPTVDQRIVAADREMAQQQLEEMYKYVMEQEEAKENGRTLDRPPSPVSKQSSPIEPPRHGIMKKGKNKPANLDLSRPDPPPEKQSRTASFLSALKSPRKKDKVKGISISSPIMTPMSGTFPHYEEREMNTIPPRHYAPLSPPPVPGQQQSQSRGNRPPVSLAPLTPPDMSPESTMSIDERLGNQLGHSRDDSQATTEVDPNSATTERSTAPLVGLPSSPKPGVNRFPSFPASPKPGATFQLPSSPKPGSSFSRPNAPSAVRTGGSLPLRAYEPALSSPSVQTTKQTTFERAPLSPGGMRTPWTGAPVPYTPYQPFSPVVPVTPSLVTKADRKKMKAMAPKTPTMHMVQSSDDIW